MKSKPAFFKPRNFRIAIKAITQTLRKQSLTWVWISPPAPTVTRTMWHQSQNTLVIRNTTVENANNGEPAENNAKQDRPKRCQGSRQDFKKSTDANYCMVWSQGIIWSSNKTFKTKGCLSEQAPSGINHSPEGHGRKQWPLHTERRQSVKCMR